ncbi:site-specific integrase [uncultured Gilvimarinus sp.]|uniref:site-specific integrase n=1 Tax=uncultured Gilvimarinus sp. TaxID=1689143 RepID=UPI0030D7E2F5
MPASYLCRKERLIGKSKQRMRRPERWELDKLLAWFSPGRRKSKIPMQDVLLFAVFSGRRQEEICTIRWDDFDERRGGVLVRDMKHPREKVDTWVDLPAPAIALIKRQPQAEGEPRIFPCDPKTVGRKFSKACTMLGVDDLRFHDLRHECASWLFECGWDIPRVARVTGHKSWATLQRYTHLSTGEVYDRWADWEWLPVKG